MDKNSFGEMLDHLGSLTPEQWDALRRERDRYPFAAPLQVLSLLADKANGAALWQQQALPRVLLYMHQADRLYEQLEALDHPVVPAQEPPAMAQAETLPSRQTAARQAAGGDEAFDVLQAINSYQEVSFKTAPKSVILSNFLEKDGGITLSDNGFEEVPIQELAKKSIAPDGLLETETLAVVLEKQGKYAQALAMYEKLILTNPEKSSTFAVRIAALKAVLSEKENSKKQK